MCCSHHTKTFQTPTLSCTSYTTDLRQVVQIATLLHLKESTAGANDHNNWWKHARSHCGVERVSLPGVIYSNPDTYHWHCFKHKMEKDVIFFLYFQFSLYIPVKLNLFWTTAKTVRCKLDSSSRVLLSIWTDNQGCCLFWWEVSLKYINNFC